MPGKFVKNPKGSQRTRFGTGNAGHYGFRTKKEFNQANKEVKDRFGPDHSYSDFEDEVYKKGTRKTRILRRTKPATYHVGWYHPNTRNAKTGIKGSPRNRVGKRG